jgi:hypothetical protein
MYVTPGVYDVGKNDERRVLNRLYRKQRLSAAVLLMYHPEGIRCIAGSAHGRTSLLSEDAATFSVAGLHCMLCSMPCIGRQQSTIKHTYLQLWEGAGVVVGSCMVGMLCCPAVLPDASM